MDGIIYNIKIGKENCIVVKLRGREKDLTIVVGFRHRLISPTIYL